MKTKEKESEKDLLLICEKVLSPERGSIQRAEIAIRDGIIEEIQWDSSVPKESRRGLTKIEIGEGVLAPAFYDAHMHLFQWGISISALDLSSCRSDREVIRTLKNGKKKGRENAFFKGTGTILGMDFDDSKFFSPLGLNKEVLDREFPDVPVLLKRICGHMAIANSLMLDMLPGIHPRGNDGILLEKDAMEAFFKVPIGARFISECYKNAVRKMHSMGVVGGIDILPVDMLARMLSSFDSIGGGLRLSISLSGDLEATDLVGSKRKDITGDIFKEGAYPGVREPPRIVFEKTFADGSIGAGTASFSGDFPDYPFRRDPFFNEGELREWSERCLDRGHLPMVHAIGDRAIDAVISDLKDLPAPFRVEHCESLKESSMDKLVKTNGILCLQPNFQTNWGGPGGMYNIRLGRRYLDLNPFRKIEQRMGRWCFGTDMMPPGPLNAIRGAMEHPRPSQRLSLFESIKGFSELSASWSLPGGTRLGKMIPGAPADLIVIKADFSKVTSTFIEGNRVFCELGRV